MAQDDRVSTGATGATGEPRVDPRVLRTRVLLQEALLDLSRERGPDAISVADIADRATVNRSTFYQHYPDRETLLADALDSRAVQAGADLSLLPAVGGTGPGDVVPADLTDTTVVTEALARYAAHVSENAQLYRRALVEGGSPIAVARLRRRITDLAAHALRRHGGLPRLAGLPPEIAAAALAGSLLGVLTAWLEQDPLPPAEDVARWALQALGRDDEMGPTAG